MSHRFTSLGGRLMMSQRRGWESYTKESGPESRPRRRGPLPPPWPGSGPVEASVTETVIHDRNQPPASLQTLKKKRQNLRERPPEHSPFLPVRLLDQHQPEQQETLTWNREKPWAGPGQDWPSSSPPSSTSRSPSPLPPWICRSRLRQIHLRSFVLQESGVSTSCRPSAPDPFPSRRPHPAVEAFQQSRQDSWRRGGEAFKGACVSTCNISSQT